VRRCRGGASRVGREPRLERPSCGDGGGETVDQGARTGAPIDWARHTPVLVDDIVATARTMIETLRQLQRAGAPPAVCVGVHAVFSQTAYDDLRAAGASRVVTCDRPRRRKSFCLSAFGRSAAVT